MKKKYSFFLMFIVLSSFSFGQNLLTNGSFETWSDATFPNSWSYESGTTITQESTIVSDGSSAASFKVTTGTQGNTDFRQSINVTLGESYNVSVDVYQMDALSEARLYAGGYQNYSDSTLLNEWQTLTYTYVATANESVQFGLRFYDQSGFVDSSVIIVDNFTVEAAVSQCGVILSEVTYSCAASTTGTDAVTINIPYTGSNSTITSVTSTTSATIEGDSPMSTDSGTISLTGLSEGDSWDVTINGGDCDGTTVSGTVPATECYPVCFDLSNGTENFEGVVVTENSDSDEWSLSSGEYYMNGYVAGQTEDIETWLVFGPLDMTDVTALKLNLDAEKSYSQTDLQVLYTNSYDACPSNSTWASASTITESGSYSVDLSSMSGTDVYVGVQYLDNDGSYSQWKLSNVLLTSDGGVCPILGARTTSNCSATASVNKNDILGFSAYPNPVSNELTITSVNNANKNVVIYNILGKQVLAKEVSGTVSKVDVSSIASGVYFLTVLEEGKVATKKLVIE